MIEVVLMVLAVAVGIAFAMRMDVEPAAKDRPHATPAAAERTVGGPSAD